MEITKQELEQILDQKLDEKLDQKLSKMVTVEMLDKKFNEQTALFDQKLDKQTKELKQFAEDQTEHLARIVANAVVSPLQEQIQEVSGKLDKKLQRTDKLEKDMLQIKTALSLS